MPRLWHDSVDQHRTVVREAVLDAVGALVADHGLGPVTMSKVAETAGIGRPTLYKYFPDVESLVLAWHERQVARHLEQLASVRDNATGSIDRLTSVLEAYASITYEHPRSGSSAKLHSGQHVAQGEQHLHLFMQELIVEGVAEGHLRDDVAGSHLAAYVLSALSAASAMPSEAAARRLVRVVLGGLRR